MPGCGRVIDVSRRIDTSSPAIVGRPNYGHCKQLLATITTTSATITTTTATTATITTTTATITTITTTTIAAVAATASATAVRSTITTTIAFLKSVWPAISGWRGRCVCISVQRGLCPKRRFVSFVKKLVVVVIAENRVFRLHVPL